MTSSEAAPSFSRLADQPRSSAKRIVVWVDAAELLSIVQAPSPKFHSLLLSLPPSISLYLYIHVYMYVLCAVLCAYLIISGYPKFAKRNLRVFTSATQKCRLTIGISDIDWIRPIIPKMFPETALLCNRWSVTLVCGEVDFLKLWNSTFNKSNHFTLKR